MNPVREWTGGDAIALRKALRMTESRFARSLGVSVRTVSNWACKPATVPRNAAQDMLDELLAAASPGVVAKFGQLTGQQPAPPRAASRWLRRGATRATRRTSVRWRAGRCQRPARRRACRPVSFRRVARDRRGLD